MTEQNISPGERSLIPCHWVEDEGFDVLPLQGPATDPRALSDTAFLLKTSALPRPIHLPAA